MGLDSESDLYSGPGIIISNICYFTIRSLVSLSVKQWERDPCLWGKGSQCEVLSTEPDTESATMTTIMKGVQARPERRSNPGCSTEAHDCWMSQRFACHLLLPFNLFLCPIFSTFWLPQVSVYHDTMRLWFFCCSSDSKAGVLAQLLFLHQVTQASSQPLDWLPLGYRLFLG